MKQKVSPSQQKGTSGHIKITHDIKQNTAEWKALRSRYRCASETSSLISGGFLCKKTPIDRLIKMSSKNLFISKIIKKLSGKIKGAPYIDAEYSTTIPAMLHGTRCEPSAGRVLVEKHLSDSLDLLRSASEVISYQDYLASIDLAILTKDPQHPKVYVEIKCPFSPQRSPYMVDSYDDLPLFAKGQVQHQIYVTGVQHIIFFVAVFDRETEHYKKLLEDSSYLIPDVTDYRRFVAPRDDELIKDICYMWDRLYNYLLNGEKSHTSDSLSMLENQYIEYSQQATHYSNLKEDCRKKIIEQIPSGEDNLCGDKIAIKRMFRSKTTINKESLEKYLTPTQLEECMTKESLEYFVVKTL